MNHTRTLSPFIKPYWQRAVLALVLLTSVVIMDLAIPRLIQRIIDHGIQQRDVSVVLYTSLLMVGISLLSTFIAIGNNLFSVSRRGRGTRSATGALFQDPDVILWRSGSPKDRTVDGPPHQSHIQRRFYLSCKDKQVL